jgi:uncharacterized protein (TIGR00369 family)
MNLVERYIQSNAFGRLIGMDFKIISPGQIEYYLTVKKEHLATPSSAHGGLISALVDGALGTAGLSLVHTENKVVSTVEYKINFLAPVLLKDQLTAKAKVEQKGKRILVISCDVFCVNRENALVAKAMGTFNAYDAVKAGY